MKISAATLGAAAYDDMLPTETSGGNPRRLTLHGIQAPIGIEDTVTAYAGGGQANATALSSSKRFHRVSTCASAGDSVKLPAATGNEWHYVRNDGAAACQVFGTSTDTINGVAYGTGVSLPVGCGAIFFSTASGKYTASPLVGASIEALVTTYLAYLNVAQSWTKAQRGTFVALTDAATIALDLSLANQYRVTLGDNRTLGVPTNIVEGQQGVISIRQDATGSRTLAYAWPYEWAGGSAGTLSTPGCSRDQLVYSVEKYATATVTITIATPGVVSWVGHGLENGQRIQLTTTGALPTGLTANTTYFVAGKGTDDFKLATSRANAAAGTYIATSGSQSGVHTMVACSISVALNKAYA